MSRTDIERLADARDHARHILQLAAERPIAALLEKRAFRRSVLFDILIIGEALNKVSTEVQSLAPSIPWRAISNTRNRFIHRYWTVDLVLVQEIVSSDLPPLVEGLDRLIFLLGAERS